MGGKGEEKKVVAGNADLDLLVLGLGKVDRPRRNFFFLSTLQGAGTPISPAQLRIRGGGVSTSHT